ncbi:MAG: deoxyribodipyrimidine photo-lyase [Alphaproteobacteria bacterium]|nr:deoxyribodipyrimidine photo-lyase [Alphaproteobacteria bacterium]
MFWHRQDLRFEDNPALNAVSKHPLLTLYILDEEDPCLQGEHEWWHCRSLSSLQRSFKKRGVQLVFKGANPSK